MEQRRLRLGDILDDYCPRERRLTNHAVVAMVEDDVKQTRCTTCDTEHVYKGAKAPRRKKTETTGKLYKQVLAGLTDHETAASAQPDMVDEPEHDEAPEPIEAVADGDGHVAASAPGDGFGSNGEAHREDPPGHDEAHEERLGGDERDDDFQPMVDDGPVHRPLIRAQLPRVEGLKLERQAPDFTIRQTAGRGSGQFRGSGGGGGGANNGQRFGRGPHRGGGGGGGGGRGGGQGFGRGPGGNPQRPGGGGGRKRGR
jgi:hypothetical protein